ncbi:MAG: C39 family peptidase [Clostridium sp.]|nr:C39 family peptidase [Clostridium sp.]
MTREERIKRERIKRRRKRRRRRRFLQLTVWAGIIVAAFVVCGGTMKFFAAQFEDISSDDTTRMSAAELKQTDDWDYIFEHKELYPDNMLEALQKNPEIQEFVKNYPDSEPAVQGGINHKEKGEEHPLFLQWDARWGYAAYGDDNIGLSGCGPACLSMVIFSLTREESATPDAIADFSMNRGYYEYGAGTSWSLLTEGAAQYGVMAEGLALDEGIMKEHLDNGHMIICSMGPGDFTTTGHFIVVYGYDREGFLVNDPYSRIRSSKSWDYETISGQIRAMWVYRVE